MTDHIEVRRGAYHDSVTLMQVSRDVNLVEGVTAAQVAMATGLNLDLVRGMGFQPPEHLGANDLLITVRATDDVAITAARSALEAALAATSAVGSTGDGVGGSVTPPRTTASAARRTARRPAGVGGPEGDPGTGPGLVLVSVPGVHAFVEAMDALAAGMSVLVFSDNVPVEHEVRLKDEAAARGLLAMGPDCGTAVVAGIGLGFANAVRPGPVGLVAASGTGAQQLMCLLDAADVGVSHCLGVGGRDLSAAIAGRSTRTALNLLDADPATELIVLISKPPDPAVAAGITTFAASLDTPVLLALLGIGQDDLTAVARRAVEALGRPWTEPPSVLATAAGPPHPAPDARQKTFLRGLFAGGTLCDEAMVTAAATFGEVRSNIPLQPGWALGPDLASSGHTMLDLGDDILTRGRAHPMIDQRSRIDRIAVEAADPSCGVLLLDVVLGHGAHPDPASELGPALAAAHETAAADGRGLAVVVSLCAAQDDPQGVRRQADALHAAGASVFRSNAAAARHAVSLLAVKAAR